MNYIPLFRSRTGQPVVRGLFIISAFAAALILSVILLAAGNPAAAAPSTKAGPKGDTGADWPMYGHDGTRGSFSPAETSINAGNIALLAQKWVVDLGGAATPAFSGAVISSDRIFAATSASTGNNLFALDATTGAPIWGANIGYNPTECFGLGVGSTPAISGTLLVVGGGDAAYYGVDTQSGNIQWRNEMNVGPSGFAWTSPLLANGYAYLGMASDCDDPSVRGELRAVNLQTGLTAVNRYFVPAGLGGAGVWNSPAMTADGQKLVVVTGEDYNGYDGPYNRALITLDPLTLNILQANKQGIPGEDQDWAATPTVFTDTQGRTLVAALHKSGTFYAYDADNIEAGPIWSRYLGLHIGTPAAFDPGVGTGGTLVIFGGDHLYAVDPATGADRWPPLYAGSAQGSIALAGGLVFVSTQGNGITSGSVMVVNESTGQTVRVLLPSHPGATNSGPIISHGYLYWRSGTYLNAWSLAAPGPSPTVTPEPTACTSSFTFADVPPDSPFYSYAICLACRGIISGYPCGGDGEPCDANYNPYLRPNNALNRGAIAKVVTLAAGYTDDPGPQLFTDVPPDHPYFQYVNNLANHEVIQGYQCGGEEEPCDAAHLHYYRPYSPASRGALAKIVSEAAGFNDVPVGETFADVAPSSPFYLWIERLYTHMVIGGYPCGGVGEPCDEGDRPYYRPAAGITRAQTAKVVAIAFYPDCGP